MIIMHNSMNGTTSMDQGNQVAHDHGYEGDQWVDMSAYNHIAMPSHGGDYYLTAGTHGLPSESIGGYMPPPPMPQHNPHNQLEHQGTYNSHVPHPLIIPTQQPPPVSWPSLRTNPSHNYSSPPVPIPPASAPPRPPPRVPSITTSQPRKTLTLQERREICRYAAEHPKVKQTEIGMRFGVERSTVSKTLRNKDKYLNYDDRSSSPIQRVKGKSPPDIERALAVWVRQQQKKGIAFNDSQMEDRARSFCIGSESDPKTITPSWLEKFKQKHNIGPGRLIRRASETAIPDSAHRLDTTSPLLGISRTPGGISPASPAGQPSPTPSSANPDSKEAGSGFMDFQSGGYKHPHHSQSTTSLSSAVTDPASSTFSAGAFSPTSQFTFPADPNSNMFGDPTRVAAEGAGFHRPRSQTFPNLEQLEYVNPAQTRDPLTPKYSSVSGTAPSSALESPANEMPAPPFGLDSAISPRTLHRASSTSSLTGRSTASGILSETPIGSSPSSPTYEDARRAVDTLLNYLTNAGFVDNNEYLVVARLNEKLKLQPQQSQQQQQQPVPAPPQTMGSKTSSVTKGIGGLSRIPEGDSEMTTVSTEDFKQE
jgi:hypothetical protein